MNLYNPDYYTDKVYFMQVNNFKMIHKKML